jgi:hypothetical protein
VIKQLEIDCRASSVSATRNAQIAGGIAISFIISIYLRCGRHLHCSLLEEKGESLEVSDTCAQ